MTVSISGTFTLVFLIVIGPIIYLCQWALRKWRGVSVDDQQTREDNEREKMTSQAYVFALVGYAIGIGNVWRFPYVISQNGGSAAVVAYLICAVFVAVPLFLYEMILGQYMKLSTIPTWKKIRPRWLSFGFAQGLMLVMAQSYFAMVIAYTLPYIAASCMDPFPWVEQGSFNFWSTTILNKYPDLNDKPPGPGPIQWHLALSLFIVSCMFYFAVAFGKKVLAKVTYVTVIMPVILVIILVIRTAFLEGANQGIAFYIGKFEGSELLRLDVWATALSQILFSLSPGFGTAITYSSFAKPKEDVYRDCMIVAVSNSLFSLFAGFGIFAMVGNLAYREGVSVEELASSGGTGLAFIIIAEAMEVFGAAKNVMSVFFFVMLLTLGLDSAFAWTETIVSIVEDLIEMRGWARPATWKTSLGVSTFLFLIGLVYTTRMGNEILDVVDHYVGIVFLLIVCFLESVIFNIDVGWQRFALALKTATFGNKRTPKGRSIFPTYLCRFDFHGTVPIMTIGLAIYTVINDARNPYGAYPTSLLAWGWALLALLVAMVFLTLWKCEEGSLPPIEEDETFKILHEAEKNAGVGASIGNGDSLGDVQKGEKTNPRVLQTEKESTLSDSSNV